MSESHENENGWTAKVSTLFDHLLACPNCHGPLIDKNEALSCPSCLMIFPIYQGVPDFRGINPDFKPSQEEINIRDDLLLACETVSFEELIKIRFSHSKECPSDLCQHQKAFELSYEQKGMYRLFQIREMIKSQDRTFSGNDLFLEIGCGSGTAIPWIMKGFDRAVGVDYSLVDLIIGSKFLKERGISNLMLVCADARHLPLPDGTFDFANATDVIEHIIPGQERLVAEARRVLKNGGSFYFNSPNRYNIFTPEPHVKVRFVGFIPRDWMNRYVKMMKNVGYTSVRLLSLNELKYIVRNTFGSDFILTGPFIDFDAPSTDFKRKIIKKFPFLLNFINRFFLFFTTNYQIMAFKTPD